MDVSLASRENEPLAQTNEEIRLCSCGQRRESFGPRTWDHLHVWGLGYPNDPTPEQRANCLSYIFALQKTLGCMSCSRHMLQRLQKKPLNMANRTTLTISLWEFHNDVNISIHKPVFSWEEFRTRYLDAKHGCSLSSSSSSSSSSASSSSLSPWLWQALGFAIAIVLILLGRLLWKWRRRSRPQKRLAMPSTAISAA
jgi:hypothetical protein